MDVVDLTVTGTLNRREIEVLVYALERVMEDYSQDIYTALSESHSNGAIESIKSSKAVAGDLHSSFVKILDDMLKAKVVR